MKILVKKLSPNAIMPRWAHNGEWIDLASVENMKLQGPQSGTLKRKRSGDTETRRRDVTLSYGYIPLGLAMKLPKGFEAIIAPRSSTFKHFGLIQSNSIGVIDSSYCGVKDEWKMPVVALQDSIVNVGERVCQFRIQPSQRASVWTKIKWLFTKKIKFVEVNCLDTKSRGGFGTSGK